MRWLITYVANAIVMLPLDFAFIGFVAKPLYDKNISQLMLPSPRMTAAILFYAIFLFGLTYLINGANPAAWQRNAIGGAVLGLATYSTFSLTNLALLRDWNWSLAAPDIAWGIVLTAITASVGGLLANWAIARLG